MTKHPSVKSVQALYKTVFWCIGPKIESPYMHIVYFTMYCISTQNSLSLTGNGCRDSLGGKLICFTSHIFYIVQNSWQPPRSLSHSLST